MQKKYNQYGEELRADGYRVFNKWEEIVFTVSPINFRRMINACFDFACLEAKYLGVEMKGLPFKRLCDVRRLEAMVETTELIQRAIKADIDPRNYEFKPLTKEEMEEVIIEKYK